jgi:energy-converting hydrogenase Eha subunit A
MPDNKDKRISGKTIALVILLTVITAVTITLLQTLVLGKANIAITGGITGAVGGAMAVMLTRKRPG